jgi:hypothetical protein
MRLRTWVVLLAPPILWACTQNNEKPAPDCNDDASLCPSSSMSANTVDCSCTCQLPNLPIPGAKNMKYEGTISACLPPSINGDQATGNDKVTLSAMTQTTFNQNVYKFCSETVADWVSLTIKSQAARFEQLPAGLACQPYRCTCETAGARFSESYCQAPCADQACSKDTCEPILRQGGVLDLSSCSCSRTTACGAMAPAASSPALCRLPGGALSRVPDRGAWHPPMRLQLAALTEPLPLDRPARGPFDSDRGRGTWRNLDRVE